jgi:hypothetical protein
MPGLLGDDPYLEDPDDPDPGDDTGEICPQCNPANPKPAGHSGAHRRAMPKPTRARVRALPTPGSGAGRQALLDEASRITEDFQYRAVAQLAPWAPIVGGTWAQNAEANTRAVLTICNSHPKVLTGVLAMAELDAYWQIGTFAVAIVVATAVEIGAVRAEGKLAAGFGITEIAAAVDAERARAERTVARRYTAGADDIPTPGGLMEEL